MRTQPSDIADFYHQLGLLVRSNLPLPESLRQLGEAFPKPDFKHLLLSLSERAAKGEKLSEAIKAHPQFFNPLHVRLITAGEATGTLPETLFTVARFARFCQQLTNRVREIVAYPLFAIHLGLFGLLYIAIAITPAFEEIFRDFLEGRPLPGASCATLALSRFLHDYRGALIPLLIASAGFSVWLFTPGIAAHRAMLAVVNIMPGSLQIVRSLDSARLCALCATFMRQKMPLHEALETSAQLVDLPQLRGALSRISQKLASGGNIGNAFAAERAVDPLITMTLKTTPEAELPAALGQLGELFEHRVTLSVRAASRNWTIIAFAAMSFVIGFAVIAMFAPLVSVVSNMCM